MQSVTQAELIRQRSRADWGNLLHCFHSEAKNQKTKSRVMFFLTLTRQIGEDLFLNVIKIICSVRQDLKLSSKKTKLDLSIIVSMSFSNKLMIRDWSHRTLIMDFLNLEEKKSSTIRRVFYEGKTSLRFSKYEVFTNWVR